MHQVIALCSFEHNGAVKKNDIFPCSPQTAKGLVKAGLVEDLSSHVASAVGNKSSASPAAQASQKQTSKRSSTGRRKTQKTEAS